ncbi:MAG: MgtC/SapB family protein [Gemmatimonadaceae bacterium]|nr:MgtC/SapB family protein [Gemmatimonadaceae bacterium]
MQFGPELEIVVRLAIASLVGLGVGLEREWSGHATGPRARFAGLRTFFLLGLIGGIAGLLLSQSHEAVASVIIAGAMAMSVGAYLMSVRRPEIELDGTTEVAALAVVLLGTLAGDGFLAISAGAGSLVVLALSEKTKLHWAVRRVGENELRAALQFAVLALVVLPLLPAGPFLGALEVRPRALWMIVLLFSGLNFVGFLARRALGPGAGYILTGLAGGLVSSTAVTLEFSRESKRNAAISRSLAFGIIGACTVLILRVLIVSGALDVDVARSLVLFVVPPFLLGAGMLAWALRRRHEANGGEVLLAESPLKLGAAIRMAIAFQIAIVLVTAVRSRWGSAGVYPAAAALGLTDMDALTVSMSRMGESLSPGIAARAIAIGIIANTVLKLGLVLGLGSSETRRIAGIGLVALALASGLGLLIA